MVEIHYKSITGSGKSNKGALKVCILFTSLSIICMYTVADVEPKERYNNYGAGRASRPYIQRARDEEVNALSHELQDIKY